MSQINPDARLMTAVGFVRGGRVADIGTDHAYLPIYLVSEHYAESAVAADINQGPIERAALNIKSEGLCEKIFTVRTDGLHGIEEYEPNDIIIFGMGGELIAKIIAEAPWVKNGKIRLILQPMTHAHDLRGYLLTSGFDIIGEKLSSDGERIYQTICAEYGGRAVTSDELSMPELMFGKKNIDEGSELFDKLLEKTANTYLVRKNGKKLSCGDTSQEDGLLEWIENYYASKVKEGDLI